MCPYCGSTNIEKMESDAPDTWYCNDCQRVFTK